MGTKAVLAIQSWGIKARVDFRSVLEVRRWWKHFDVESCAYGLNCGG